ncbi:hypothetical protein ACHAQH_007553 [Verticillium albo-atrum]
MADYYIEDFSSRAVQKLTAILTLPPQHGLVRPTSGWLARQSKAVESLPKTCLRPPIEAINPIKLIKRGLMKVSEKHSLPFVPDAAILCQAHKELHPWRMRSIFLLLASECGIRSDRIRRHKGFDGIPPSQDVQDFVFRMTSVSSLWIAPEDYEARFGYRPSMFPLLKSGCEACMLSIVGARAQLLVDLRANLLARSKRGYEPSFLRFVDAWIEWFDDDDASTVLAESRALSDQLRQIRREIGRRRRQKRKKARSEGRRSEHSGRIRREEETTAEGYSIPRPPRRSDTVGSVQICTGDVPPFPEAQMPGARHGYESGEYITPPMSVVTSGSSEPDWFAQNHRGSRDGRDIEPPTPMTPMGNPFSDPTTTRDDDEEEDNSGYDEAGPGWASQVGSYYFGSDNNPGARAGWGQNQGDTPSRAPSVIHPAFQSCLPPDRSTQVRPDPPTPVAPAASRAPTEWTDVTVRTERSRVSSVAGLTRDAVEPNTPVRARPVPSNQDAAVLRRQLEQLNLQTGAPPTYAPSSAYSRGTGAGGGDMNNTDRTQQQNPISAALYAASSVAAPLLPPANSSRYAALNVDDNRQRTLRAAREEREREIRNLQTGSRTRANDFMGRTMEREGAAAAFETRAEFARNPLSRAPRAEPRRRGSSAGDEFASRRNHFPRASREERRRPVSEASEGTVFDMFIRHHDEVRPGDSISTVGSRREGALEGLVRGER